MGSFDAFVGGFSDYVKKLVSQNPEAFGVTASAPPTFVFDPVTGQVVQRPATDVMSTVFKPMGNQYSPVPTSLPDPAPMAPRAASAPIYQQPSYQPQAGPWKETGATKAAYGQSANLYAGYGGQMGDFAKAQMQAIQNWNETYNTGGPQVRAFAPSPFGYDAQGYSALRDVQGNFIYADETSKIAEALKRLQPAAPATTENYTPYFNAAMPDRSWVV